MCSIIAIIINIVTIFSLTQSQHDRYMYDV